ncbi:MAG: 5-dehydro-4-deoxy-D-glucuronate isomerase [Spirochaetales bacterium]|nr:5-dehydro-4-deoxy-D-glucuronate isomerase [Spirochaetales bacterium]
MEIRHPIHPEHAKRLTTDELRNNFLVKNIFKQDEIKMVYSHIDRIIIGGILPAKKELSLEAGKEIGVTFFLERREMGIINIGGKGSIKADGTEYLLESRDGIYIGKGTKEITFKSIESNNPAKFYFNSVPAHIQYPVKKISIEKATPIRLGSLEESNKRTIYQYIHPATIQSCQLVMGVTILEPNNVWNTMPCHTHERRMEVYFYFYMPENTVVFHFIGEPGETRHIVVRNEEAVIMPGWSIHSGVGTKNYTFIWGMAGENQAFSDMDHVPMPELK